MFHVQPHLKEADLKVVVESNLFTRGTLAFHPEASERHAGSSLGFRIYGNSVANIYLINSHIKFLPKLHINTYSQLVETEGRKCHPEFSLALIKRNRVLLCAILSLQAKLH